jgi:hypothetical protein
VIGKSARIVVIGRIRRAAAETQARRRFGGGTIDA